MVVEVNENEIKFIHSSTSGVIISSTKEYYYGKKFYQINSSIITGSIINLN
jgi:hypothetical protein